MRTIRARCNVDFSFQEFQAFFFAASSQACCDLRLLLIQSTSRVHRWQQDAAKPYGTAKRIWKLLPVGNFTRLSLSSRISISSRCIPIFVLPVLLYESRARATHVMITEKYSIFFIFSYSKRHTESHSNFPPTFHIHKRRRRRWDFIQIDEWNTRWRCEKFFPALLTLFA